MTDKDQRIQQLGLMCMKLRESWWPFVHSAGPFVSSTAKNLLHQSADVLNGAVMPIDMILYCPNCGEQHVDAPQTDAQYNERLFESSWWELGGDKPERWSNPPHRSHLCHACGCIWRPADVPTNGVASIQTEGKADTWPAYAGEVVAAPAKR